MTAPRRSGGGRQRLWAALRRMQRLPTESLMDASGLTHDGVYGYLRVLRDAGYMEGGNDGWRLIRDTGEISPAVNIGAGTLHDWNLNPPMSGERLRAIWVATGLSMRQFALAVGLNGHHGTRLKHMMDGQKPVSPTVEAAAKALGGG